MKRRKAKPRPGQPRKHRRRFENDEEDEIVIGCGEKVESK